ncbi:LysM peptidoglycan-binding domain-containing protein [Paenibacillus sp. TRM 82003]|nr:LysM peptidoglycan-binding domain-containing protein [Paenibacillus sp. TRM 82003]
MGLQKAIIKVKRGENKSEEINVLFNPSEYSIEESNNYNWKKIPGLNQQLAVFVSGTVPTLTMDLFFDTSETWEDVREHTTKITSLLDIVEKEGVPPLCTFAWGSLKFEGIIEKVSQKFTMFLDSGIPVRATLNVTFKRTFGVAEKQNNAGRSSNRTKQKTVKQGDAIWRIASDEFGDPSKWRDIAKANNLDDPKRLESGSTLKIPR